jgi:uncharacterized membrane protein
MANFSSTTIKSWLPNWRVASVSFQLIIVIVLSLGLFWRFDHLDRKVYWLDETFTSFHLSGYTDQEVSQTIVNGSVISVQDLHQYQVLNPDRTVAQTLQHIAATAPELPPLYFVLLRSWVGIFGDDIAVIRTFSALLSLLIFPAVYWLSWELFKSSLVGWVAIGLIAVSPFHVICAQEARPYTLWLALTLSSGAMLLKALRRPTPLNWVLYIAASTLGFYTHLLTLLVWLSQAIYVALIERFRVTQTSLVYLKSSAFIGLLFLPWILYCLVRRFDVINDVPSAPKLVTGLTLIKGWIRCLSLFFVDFNLEETSAWQWLILFGLIVAAGLAIIGAALVNLGQRWPRSLHWFLWLAIGVPTVTLILSDLLLTDARSTIARYLLPSYTAIQIAVAALLARQISQPSRYQGHWRLVLGSMMAIGMLSCLMMTSSPFWWNKADDRINTAIATKINQSTQALVVSDAFFVKVFMLSHGLNDRVNLQLVKSPQVPTIPAGFSEVWLYDSSPQLQQTLQQHYRLTPIYPPRLWQVSALPTLRHKHR